MLRIDVELSDHEQDERGATKKANKPLMEKRRRARINRCLYEMKQMLVDGINTGSPGQSKWEKADILEMSVAYMRQLQKRTLQAGIDHPLTSSQFLEGFSECLKEVKKFNADVTLSPEVQEHNARLSGHLTVHLHKLTQNPRAKLRSSSDEISTQESTSAALGAEYSPAHSQTSPSSSSSAATSPKSSPFTRDEPPTPQPPKRYRKSAHHDRQVGVPLPASTLSLQHPQPSKTNEISMLGVDPRCARLLPVDVEHCVLGQLLSCVRPLGVKHPHTQQFWPTTTDLITACNDIGTLNNPWIHNLWRPF